MREVRIPLTRSNVIALDYRGFGSSTGTPSEPGLLLDARTVWDFVQDVKSSSERAIVHDEIHGFHIQSQSSGGTTSTSTSNSGKDVILLGQSLGTGVASALAGQLADEGECTGLKSGYSRRRVRSESQDAVCYSTH